MKLDPYKHKEKYQTWKEKIDEVGFIEGISRKNSDLILRYIFDMEVGINVSSKSSKGARSYIRLNTLKQRMIFLARKFEECCGVDDITKLNEESVIHFFAKMRSGEMRRIDGGAYKSTADFVKNFKAFWHWYLKASKKRGDVVEDITCDLDCSREKPRWVYLTEDQVRYLWENVKYDYRILIMFLFDTGIRAPTELMNIRVSDFLNDFSELNIRDEISKTFGRRIKLMICPDAIREYVLRKELSADDYLFKKTPHAVNLYLRRVGEKLFGDKASPAGQKYSQLTMYDFRHISCCYWLPKYKSESALKFRFGWKKSDKIHYYSEMLGMRDTIDEDDMLDSVKKTELEKEQIRLKNDNEILKEEMRDLRKFLVEVIKGIDLPLKNTRYLENEVLNKNEFIVKFEN